MGSLIATSLFTIDAKNDRNVNSTSNLMCEKDAHIPSRQKQSIEEVELLREDEFNNGQPQGEWACW
ncbi:predicted protein [Botrytis cinerea T4]|uniref:Uncharacterized protein n=1 Tax=Botryotinia fuckeliana (strain T4) TaxID=999810 RepID=G2YA70_BOTF4|nr:predicted protein [Botrytis cinerea T4]